MTRWREAIGRRAFLVVILVWAPCMGCDAARTAVPNAPRTAVPDAPDTDILRKAASFLQARQAFRVVVEIEEGMESPRFGKRKTERTCHLSAARPGRLAMREQGEGNGMIVVADGQQFSRGALALKKYAVGENPAALDDVFYDPLANLLLTAIGTGFFKALSSDDVYDKLTYDAIATRNLGVEEVDGRACQHLRLEQNETIWDLWVDTAEAPLFRKVAIQPKEKPGAGEQDDKLLRVSVEYRFRDWELDPKFADDEFAFEPPSDWEKVDSLFPRLPLRNFGHQRGSLTELGDSAPDVTITPLAGEAFQLSDLRGRVVLLNFFATWCGPCKLELPDIERFWTEFHGHDDFRLFVIGREETAEAVRSFQQEHGFTFPMAADEDRAAFDRFAKESIPRTYLIDREGKIVYQCIGYDVEKKERDKLRALLKQQLGEQE